MKKTYKFHCKWCEKDFETKNPKQQVCEKCKKILRGKIRYIEPY